jgi:hypothetical protein
MRKSAKSKKPVKHFGTHKDSSVTALRLKYRFMVLIGVLVLAGIAIMLKTESPSVWTFLYGIGGWAALTTHSMPKS